MSRTFSTCVSAFGFDDFILSCHKPRQRDVVLAPTLTSLPPEALADYRRRDPSARTIMARAARAREPFGWKVSHHAGDERLREVTDFLRAHALHCGLVIPLWRRPGTISVIGLTARDERDFPAHAAAAATVLATAALLKADLMGLCMPSDRVPAGLQRLSRQQEGILGWAAAGKSNPDIATIMGLSERAVKYHVSEILRKLGVATRAQAIALHRRSIEA